MNFTYKNPYIYDKKYAILKQLEVEERIKKDNQKSIIKSFAKKEFTKVQDVETTMIESKEARGPVNEKDLYDIKNITNTTSIQVQDVETTMIESKVVNTDTIINSNTYLTIDIDTKFAKKFETKVVNTDTDLIIDIDIKFAKKFEIIENIQVYNNNDNNNNEIVLPYDVERIRKKGVKIIHNVYQSKYSNGAINGTGFGDFIRGCYFLLEFCEKYHFEPRILFNNCISKFLLPNKNEFTQKELIQPLLENIDMFHSNNFKEYMITQDQTILQPKLDLAHIMYDFVEYIMKAPVYNGNTFIYCIPYPLQHFSQKSKAYMQTILEPIDEIKCLLQQSLQNIGLNFKDYFVFHIRSGDNYLNKDNKIFYQKYLDKIKIKISNYISMNTEVKYLLIADNNEIKILMKQEFPQLKILLREITHFGEGAILEEEKVKNTLIDFYLLSFANKIISFSEYKHGSGFSYWCATTFDVPYISKYIEQ